MGPPVLPEEVGGPGGGAVAAPAADGGQVGPEVALRHVPQAGLAEEGGHGAHLRRDGGVGVRQVGVVGPHVDDAQGVAQGGGVQRHLFHLGRGDAQVHGHGAANGAGRLIHQAAGLAEPLILRLLGHHGQLHGGDGFVTEKAVQHLAHQHLKGGAAGKAGTGGNMGIHADVAAGHGKALLPQQLRHALHQGAGGGLPLTVAVA